jgi:hypothetical protein
VLDHSCQVQRHPHSERGVDLYETPRPATEALLHIERIPHRVWEPCCGPGAVVQVLRERGHEVYATDLVDYGDEPADHYGRDFLLETTLPPGVEMILTNPPFKNTLAEKIIARALELCPRVIMLLRLAFYESERRRPILEGRGLARARLVRDGRTDSRRENPCWPAVGARGGTGGVRERPVRSAATPLARRFESRSS